MFCAQFECSNVFRSLLLATLSSRSVANVVLLVLGNHGVLFIRWRIDNQLQPQCAWRSMRHVKQFLFFFKTSATNEGDQTTAVVRRAGVWRWSRPRLLDYTMSLLPVKAVIVAKRKDTTQRSDCNNIGRLCVSFPFWCYLKPAVAAVLWKEHAKLPTETNRTLSELRPYGTVGNYRKSIGMHCSLGQSEARQKRIMFLVKPFTNNNKTAVDDDDSPVRTSATAR
jgi:hypothetical protein